MPNYYVTQPNGLYARWSTIVDNFVEVDATEADAMAWYRSKIADESEIAKQWKHVVEDIDTHGLPPCCDEKPLRRWHDCLNGILHVHGTAELAKFLAECPSTYAEKPK